jgi:hypothetical protein
VDLTDLRPGAVILVAAGASLIRLRPYQLVLTDVSPSADPDLAHVLGTQLRADGTPTRRRHSGRADVIIPSRLQLITPAPAAPTANAAADSADRPAAARRSGAPRHHHLAGAVRLARRAGGRTRRAARHP